MPARTYDAIVVGAGPNGLAAAITIAQAGRSVLLLEAAGTIGGGARTCELTVPGFLHDVCSAIHPMALASPFFRTLPLDRYGLEWIQPPAPLAHPFDDGTAVVLERTVDDTAAALGADGARYRDLFAPLVRDWDRIATHVLGPLRFPDHPLAAARFGLSAIRSAAAFCRTRFSTGRARALFAGFAAHSIRPLEDRLTAGVGLVLMIAGHVHGWPLPRGGAQSISNALAAHLRSLGGEIRTGILVTDLRQLPPARALLLNVTPRNLIRIAGDRLPAAYRRKLSRYRYGPGAFKIDWALDGLIPWRASECNRAATLHLGGMFEEIAASERSASQGDAGERPYVLLAQPSRFDPTRAPAGMHTAWAYCHVPNGSTVHMTDRIEAQVERFAPGFRALVLARHTRNAMQMEADNPNLVGGDINCGVRDVRQFLARPSLSPTPYRTPARGIYICSAATPPGGAVHGMCGYYAARAALRDVFR